MATRPTGRVLVVLVCAQFIITIDTTFMNVSLSTLVKDLHTTVTGVQNAITLYALVMAALMIAGAKFGDIIGRKRAFIIGLITYAIGTTVTSLSRSLPLFLIGWSLLEGIGASIMLPAMLSLIADNFPAGQARTRAYATFAAAAGVAAAIGPIVGGLFTTYLSWRLAFASELIVALFILLQRHIIREQKLSGPTPRFDWMGFCLSAVGLVTMVEGIILASTYGILHARTDFVIAGKTILHAGGVSPTVILVLVGVGILCIFAAAEARRSKDGKNTLLNISLFKVRAVSTGSIAAMTQQLMLTGVIFALSLYVQMNLTYNAIKSGLTLLPLSLGVMLFSAAAGRRFSKRYAPRSIMLCGFTAIVVGVLIMGLTARNATSGLDFAIGLAFIGSGVGLVVSQNQNVMISSVPAKLTNEVAGVINTFLNIGASLGTALAGALILESFISVATTDVMNSSTFTNAQKTTLDQAITTKAQIVSNQQLSSKVQYLPQPLQREIIDINERARQRSLTVVYYALGAVGLLGLVAVFMMPKTKPLASA